MKTFIKRDMKKMLLFVMAIASLAIIPACANDIMIPTKKLPKIAQEFLNTHFAGKNVVKAIHDRDITDNDYTVWLDNGTKIEFDSKGNWESIKNKSSYVADSVIPAKIKEYVTTNYPSLGIVKIEKSLYGYEVELSNDLDLKFDSDGNFQRIDD